MKITKSQLKQLIYEVLNEEDDKFTKKIEDLKKKKNILEVNAARIGVQIAQTELEQAIEQEQTASDTLDAAEARGEDKSKETESLNNAKKKTADKKANVTSANEFLKSKQKST